MLARRLVLIASLGLAAALSGCAEEQRPEPTKPDQFEVALAVAPQDEGKLGRVVLPAAAVAEIKRPDLGDVRIFDAKGRSLSLALGYDRSGGSSVLRTSDLPAIPIAAGKATTPVPVSVEVKAGDTALAVTATDAAIAVDERVAVLIDTRTLALPVVGVEIKADLPRRVPVTFTLEAGEDLKTWEPLAQKVLLRTGNDPEVLGQPRIALPSIRLKDRYVRISWEAVPDVNVSGVRVFEAVERPEPRVDLETSGAALASAHEIGFAPQIAVPIAAIKLEMTGQDGMVPVQLLGRNDRTEPWGLLASGTLKQGEGALTLELSGATLKEYKLLADKRSAGFSKVPKVSLSVEPITLFAAFNNEGPFNLVTGNIDAKPAWFDPADLGKPSELLRAWKRPAEVASAGEAPVILLAPAAPETPFDPRTLGLWAALLLGVGVLGFAAWRIIRAGRTDSAQPAAG
ncbi:MAG: DUF3999 family protein, partial [Novosphingobium sp.]